MKKTDYPIRNANPGEFDDIGQALMVEVYSHLEGFPGPEEQPGYYQTLSNVGSFTAKPGVELLVAVSSDGKIDGAVVFFADMQFYGSGGAATQEKKASGFRLLAVDHSARGQGLGKLLTFACIEKARANKHRQLVIHSTRAMQTAWKMYLSIGFERSPDLDFMQGELPVFGFRLTIPSDQ